MLTTLLFSSLFIFANVEPNEKNTQQYNGDGVSALQIFRGTNAIREEVGSLPLEWNECLSKEAKKRAKQIVDTGLFAHEDITGKMPYSKQIEICDSDWNWAGENLAKGYKSGEDTVKAWVNSRLHYLNLVREEYTEIGIACEKHVCVQFFANFE
jgi:uncharacterized protein YkwD